MSVGAKGEDLKCYRGIIYRIQQGEGYYQAAHAELSSRGYPTKSVFNWRLPFLGWLLGHIPDARMSRAIPMLLSLFALWLWITLKIREWPIYKVAAGTILAAGFPIYTLLDDIYIIHELWAGILIFISLAAHGRGWKTISCVSGILAFFIRELALPFAAIMTVSSLVERRKQEALAWGMGIIAFLGCTSFISDGAGFSHRRSRSSLWILVGFQRMGIRARHIPNAPLPPPPALLRYKHYRAICTHGLLGVA